ncbi:MAG: DNA polymerase I [Candidatus Binataceae bacterium]|jgi:DNA polymerase-1
MAESRSTLYLVDGSGYMFRAFHAIPPLNNSRGLPTNATFGFIRMLLKLLKDTRPSHLAIVFDPPGKTFRDDLFEDYKANRTAMPSDLGVQIPYIHRAVDALRIPRLMIDGFEADDVIGTLAVRAARGPFDSVIVTGDKDFKQLVGPHITLLDTMNDKRTTVREVREQFGVGPEAVVDIMALMGDAIDNVKGLPGVGPKTACALIQHFGSLEAMFAGLDRLEETNIRGAKKLRALIAEHRGDVELARKLVRIDTDVALHLAPNDLVWPGYDEKALADLMRELEFNAMLAELTPAQRALPASSTQELRVGRDDLPSVLADLARAPRLALHLAVTAKGATVLKLKGEGDARLFTLGQDLFEDAAALLSAPTPPKTCHDLKTHIGQFRRYRIDLHGVDFDTMLAGFLVNPGKTEPSLGDLYHQFLAPLGAAPTPGDTGDTGSEPALAESIRTLLVPRLAQDGLDRLLAEIEIPVARVLAEMEAAGIGVDANVLAAISTEFGGELERLERECFELAGHPFNLNSPIQLRDILFNELKLSAKGLKKTKSGFSTDADTLEKLAEAHPLPAKLLEYRGLAKLKSTYSDALPTLIDPADGRIHTRFHQALAATGRLSSTDPNLQNIPVRSEAGRRIRRAFVPRPGRLILSADYSQIELRILAHLSADPTLTEAFSTGEDIHAHTASEVLGIAKNQIDAEARRLAKVINFGIIYGMGPQRLAAQLGISFADASDYIKRYFERLPGVRTWLDRTLEEARERGYVTTMYGRRRYLPELRGGPGGARAQAERIAINTPIQGTAADLIKLAMVRLHSTITEKKLAAQMLLQVHDELLLEVDNDALEAAGAAVRGEMEGVAALRVPLRVELKAGPNWAELKSDAPAGI